MGELRKSLIADDEDVVSSLEKLLLMMFLLLIVERMSMQLKVELNDTKNRKQHMETLSSSTDVALQPASPPARLAWHALPRPAAVTVMVRGDGVARDVQVVANVHRVGVSSFPPSA